MTNASPWYLNQGKLYAEGRTAMMKILETLRSKIEGDRSARLVAEDPTLTAELLLLFRVMLADGQVRDEELVAFKRICREAFGLDPDNMEGVYQYLEDYAYEITATQATEMFKHQPRERRQALLNHMIDIAESDAHLDQNEVHVIKRTSSILGFDLRED
jgi:uncharacterized tellurite resistance protein B-like protein